MKFNEALKLSNRMVSKQNPSTRLSVNLRSCNVLTDKYKVKRSFEEAIEVFISECWKIYILYEHCSNKFRRNNQSQGLMSWGFG